MGFADQKLRRGSRGDAVRVLQELLNALGYDAGTADGIFGGGTERALKIYQRAYGLGSDGIVGAMTGAALDATAEFGGDTLGQRELRVGSRGDDVRQLQEALAAQGCDPGDADGSFGPSTLKAALAFQEAQGIEATGVCGASTCMALAGVGGLV